jgi:hypothetical protein
LRAAALVRSNIVVAAAMLGLLSAARQAAATPVLIDTFEDATTMGWGVPGPHPAPPTNIATGGPAGADDNYLQLTAFGGSASGSRLSALNSSQWAGDYLAAGLTLITMDVANFGPDDVVLRLLLEDFEGFAHPANLVTTLTDVLVPAGSGWVSVSFDLSPSNLVVLFGSAAGALSNVDTLRIFHNPEPAHAGPFIGPAPVNAIVGLDNIAANAAPIPPVPEPASLVLVAAGLAASLGSRARANRARRLRR